MKQSVTFSYSWDEFQSSLGDLWRQPRHNSFAGVDSLSFPFLLYLKRLLKQVVKDKITRKGLPFDGQRLPVRLIVIWPVRADSWMSGVGGGGGLGVRGPLTCSFWATRFEEGVSYRVLGLTVYNRGLTMHHITVTASFAWKTNRISLPRRGLSLHDIMPTVTPAYSAGRVCGIPPIQGATDVRVITPL